jgi:hypothetical protein
MEGLSKSSDSPAKTNLVDEQKAKLNEDYRRVMQMILDIVQLVVSMVFEKLATIPYSIRQFCKCLYQATKEKFGSKNPDFF